MVIDVILGLGFLFVVLGIGRAVQKLRIHTLVYYFFRILFFKKPGILTQKMSTLGKSINPQLFNETGFSKIDWLQVDENWW